MNRGANTREYWEQKHTNQYEVTRSYDYSKMSYLSYIKVACDIIKENKEVFKQKTILDVGCAVGKAVNYYKKQLPSFKCVGYDFSTTAIEAARKKSPENEFYVVDILETPVKENFGCITMLEVIEHIEEGKNYEVINNLLDHCEYLIISTVDTTDNCFGEHISHYTLDTFEEKGYNVLWKSQLDEIKMPDGIYHYILFLIKGNL